MLIVFLLLVTPLVTLPVGFRFYRPDPNYQAWKKEDDRLKKQGVKKAERPKPPTRDPTLRIKQHWHWRYLQNFGSFSLNLLSSLSMRMLYLALKNLWIKPPQSVVVRKR